ncbi:hypothetical protein PUN28_019072 [Cardiocondyla obscurior]|uniref:Uncharacterized protein n=1 Tax=Cardiocondyla obscurior TaxID=286306 RepID=A0AAW2ED86_9HYME
MSETIIKIKKIYKSSNSCSIRRRRKEKRKKKKRMKALKFRDLKLFKVEKIFRVKSTRSFHGKNHDELERHLSISTCRFSYLSLVIFRNFFFFNLCKISHRGLKKDKKRKKIKKETDTELNEPNDQ